MQSTQNEFTLRNPPYVDLKPYGLVLHCDISNCADEELNEAMDRWLFSPNEIVISQTFKLSEVLDQEILFHRLWRKKSAICATSRPLFMQMKAELLELVQRIDALEFVDPKELDE